MKLPLLDQAGLFVTAGYVSKNPPVPVHPENVGFTGAGPDPDFGRIDMDLAAIMETYSADPSASDGPVAVALRRSLPLTRREAAEMRFWHYLGLVKHPSYIAWRYFDQLQGKTNKHFFVGRLSDHALARLWWFAELTMEDGPEPFRRTMQAAQSPEFVAGVLENLFGGNRILVSVLADVLFRGEKPADATVKRLFTQINARLVSVAIDALDETDIPRLIEGMI